MLAALLSLGISNAACPDAWWSGPSPQDTRPNYVQRHRELTWEVTAGRGANPIYRDSWARMDVDLTLRAHNQEGLLLDEFEQDRYRDLTLTAATLAGELLLDELTSQGELLSSINLAARTLSGPSLVIGDEVQVRPTANSRYQAQLQARAMEPGQRLGRPRRLTLGAGSNVVGDPLDPTDEVGWAWTAYVAGQRVGPDSFRVGVDVVQWQPGLPDTFDSTLAWRAWGRHNLHPRYALVGDARSVNGSFMPRHVRGGLEHKVMKSRRVFLRTSYFYGFEQPERHPEHRAEVRLTWSPRWRVPVRGEVAPWDPPPPHWTPRIPAGDRPVASCSTQSSEGLAVGVVPGP